MIIIPRSEVCGLLFAMETAKMVGNKLPDFTFYFTQIFENKFTQGKIKLVQGIDILKRSIVLVNAGHGIDERGFVSSDQGKISDIF